MADQSEQAPHDALKQAFWITDIMVEALPGLLATAHALEQVAQGEIMLTLEDAEKVRRDIEGFAFAFGILQSALTDLRLATPGDGK